MDSWSGPSFLPREIEIGDGSEIASGLINSVSMILYFPVFVISMLPKTPHLDYCNLSYLSISYLNKNRPLSLVFFPIELFSVSLRRYAYMNPALTSELTPEIRRNGVELFVTQSLVRNLQIQQAYKEKFIPMMSKVWAAVEADFLIHPESVPMGELEFPRPDMYNNYQGGSDDILRGLGIIPQDAKSTDGSTAHIDEFQRILAEKGITRAVVGAEGIYSELKALFRSGIPERGAVVLVNKRGSDRLVVKPLAGNKDVLFIYIAQWKKCYIAANPEIFQKAQAAKPVVAETVAPQKSGGATAQVASNYDLRSSIADKNIILGKNL